MLNGVAPRAAQIASATSLVQGQGITPNQVGVHILPQYAHLGLSSPFAIDNRGLQTPNSGVLKIDHNFSNSDSLSARYFHGNGEDEFPGGEAPAPVEGPNSVHGLA